jgi:hypothetical protein
MSSGVLGSLFDACIGELLDEACVESVGIRLRVCWANSKVG